MWLKCTAGCRFFKGIGKDGCTVCLRVPTPVGVNPLVGCYWGEPQPKGARRKSSEGKEQERLF